MYAQLCSRLCEDAPNFEPPGSSGPSTFRRLLIAKCQDEFENRSKAFAAFDKNEGPLTSAEQEQKQIAKHKMLGNIKFIGELGKLDMLHESILHRCIKQLLDKKKKQNVKDVAEDLECLCQIIKTVGPRLDTEKAKALVDQYFGRMRLLANNEDLPARIRFMLEDTLELRECNWVPRKVLQDNSPKTMDQVRQEAVKCSPQIHGNVNSHINDYGVYMSYNSNHKQSKNFFPLDDGLMSVLPQKHGGLSDVFMPTIGSSIGTGPGVIQDGFNGYTPHAVNVGRTRSGGDVGNRSGSNSPNQGYQNYANPKGQTSRQQQDGNGNQGNLGYQNRQANQQRDMAPRFMKKSQFNNLKTDEISLRPARDSMVLKPQASSMMPSSLRPSGSLQQQHTLLQPTPQQMIIPPQNIQTSPKVPVKHSHGGDKPKHKKQTLNKEDLKKLTESILEEYLKNVDVTEVISRIKEMRVPRKQMSSMVCQLMVKSLEKDDDDGAARELVSKLIKELKSNGLVTEDQCMEGFTSLLEQLPELETEMPLVKSSTAGFAARAINNKVITLSDLAVPMQNGNCYPLFLLTLQQLHKLKDKEWLVQLFNESKINMQSMLPERDKKNGQSFVYLSLQQLSFLFPLLRMQSDISKQLKADPNPSTLYKWIKDNVDNKLHADSEFIYALTLSLVKYCTSESTLSECMDASLIPDKQLQEKERALLNNLKPVLQAFIHDHVQIQLSALYALQVHCYNNGFPKGMLLRFFVYFYDMEVVEEEVFLKWKEDINDNYMGKGKALFQVNSWLTWLETADEEEESEDDDDDQ
ncbi:eukaryotic translation initiation factor 4 gamma 2-like [Saccoglossus kowalevskii]|uniref:Eukaryotic translation initiation factor 4 gamma 2 n=1 Tax=Saccoglossus kowalevskii TaxID=10224 RepID=A0ABM0MGM5_SACKO|nr:PREDICTED: eukaryotic translation initiation factor 4 gamma 2-like [Saccoglossus kowalevskii]